MVNLGELFEFPTILLVIGMVLLLIAVVIGIFAFQKPKKKEKDMDIEDKLENMSLEDHLDRIKEITETKKEDQQIEILKENPDKIITDKTVQEESIDLLEPEVEGLEEIKEEKEQEKVETL